MYIYLLTNGTYYKIGKSKNPENRIKQLNSGSSEKIELIYKFRSPEYYHTIEIALHNFFSNKRVNSEWFELTPKEALSFIPRCIKIEENLIFLKENKI